MPNESTTRIPTTETELELKPVGEIMTFEELRAYHEHPGFVVQQLRETGLSFEYQVANRATKAAIRCQLYADNRTPGGPVKPALLVLDEQVLPDNFMIDPQEKITDKLKLFDVIATGTQVREVVVLTRAFNCYFPALPEHEAELLFDGLLYDLSEHRTYALLEMEVSRFTVAMVHDTDTSSPFYASAVPIHSSKPFGQAVQTEPEPIAPEQDELTAFIEMHEKELGYRFHAVESLADRASSLVLHYRTVATDSMRHSQNFKTEILVALMALKMVADSVGDASTHREKDARLRGLVSVLESAYTKLSNYSIDIKRHNWAYEDVFRSDFPTRELLNRIHALEQENAQLRGQEISITGGDRNGFDDPFAE